MSLIDKVTSRFKEYEEDVQTSGIVAAFFNFFQGRATAFAIAFTICGIVLAFRGKLDANYALFVTAIQGLVFAHSCKEDWHQQKMAQAQQTVNNITVTNDSTSKITSSTPVTPSEGQ